MNRIQSCFADSKQGNKLVCYLTAGHPDFETTVEVVRQIHTAGADMVELGIPFSDPMADGPIIQQAAFEALQNGATVAGVLDCVREIRKSSEIPIVLMTYLNPILHYGLNTFASDAANAGVDGILATDLPVDEAGEWMDICRSTGLDTVFLVAPGSTDHRIKLSAQHTTGFIYCVSRYGVTGVQNSLASGLTELVMRIKSFTEKPVAVGFGISNAKQVQKVCEIADAAVVGSALVKVISESETPARATVNAAKFVRSLKTPSGENSTSSGVV